MMKKTNRGIDIQKMINAIVLGIDGMIDMGINTEND